MENKKDRCITSITDGSRIITYYYVLNAQGDVIALVNSSGAEVVTYAYDPWGDILSTGGSMVSTLGQINPLRYRGYVYDTETGLYYLQTRYYNPVNIRFNWTMDKKLLNYKAYFNFTPIGYSFAEKKHSFVYQAKECFFKMIFISP